jgi:hypothetical protein
MASLAPAEKATTGKPLKVGSPHDPAEREADRIADLLTAPEEPAMPVCTACAAGGAPCAACGGGDGGGVLRRQLAASGDGGSGGEMVAPPSVHRVLSEPGEPLPAGSRKKFERRLGVDLGAVRMHHGREAEHAAAALGARAFALGPRIVFGASLYPPAGAAGIALLGHELAHTLQPGAERVLRRNQEADGGSGAGPGSDPLDAGVPDPIAGVGPATATPATPGMSDTQRLERIRAILTNLWVGPLDEWELESLWGGFGSRLETVAGANLDLWNQSWQRGASLANLPEVRRFLRGFEASARANLAGVLTDSENRINAERISYGVREITTETIQQRLVPTGDVRPMWESVPVVHRSYQMDESPQATGLQASAGELVTKRTEVDGRLRTLRQRQRQYERTAMHPTTDFGGEHSMELRIEVTNPSAHAAVAQEIRDAEGEYEALRVQLGARYPILSAYSGDEGRAGLQRLATTGAGASTAEALYAVIAERLANIARVRNEMGDGGRVVVWKLPQILSMTRAEMGISDDSLRAFMVAARVDLYESDHAMEQLALGAIALGLGLLAAVPTGGSSLVAAGAAVAAVGGAGVSAYVAYEGVQTYLLESAATGTDFDRARAISQSEPSLFWLALDIVGALVDAGAAVAAIRAALRTATTAYRELAPLVRAAARTGESSEEAMDALRVAAARQGLSGAVIERIVAGARRMRAGADEAAVALARVEHAELDAGRALVRETEFVAELAESGAHGWKITASGQLCRCSQPCMLLRGMFSEQLARHPDLEGRLVSLETRARAAAAANNQAEGQRILGEIRDLEGRLRDLAPPVVPHAEAGMGGRMRTVANADDLEVVRMSRPEVARPPASVTDAALSAEQRALRQRDWDAYCRYYEDRVRQLEHELGTGTVTSESPIDWDSYQRFVGSDSPFQRGRGFQAGVTGGMEDPAMAVSYLTEGDIALSRTARPTSEAGQIVRPDQFMVDMEQLRLMQDGRLASTALDVTAASNKSRDFGALFREGTQAELRAVEEVITADVSELFSKYSGTLHVRRQGPLLGREVHVRELILVYDAAQIPPAYREVVRSIASRLGSSRAKESGFSFWIAIQ